MTPTKPPKSDFSLYPDPNNAKWIKASPKIKYGRVGELQQITFGNYGDNWVRVTFPAPLGGPDHLDIGPAAQETVTIIPDCEGNFACPVFALLDLCPTCGSGTRVPVTRDGVPLAADSTGGGTSIKVPSFSLAGEGDGADADPIIKINP